MRKPGFNNGPGFSSADGFQDDQETLQANGFDNCGGCSGNIGVDGFDNAAAIEAGENYQVVRRRNGGFSNADAIEDGENYVLSVNGDDDNADGDEDNFCFDADGNFVGDEGQYNALGEHYAEGDGTDHFHFNAEGEYDADGDYDADGEHFENFLPAGYYRRGGFSNADGFDNAKGKRAEKKAAKQAAKQERKAAKTAANVENKKANTEAKVAKKAAKTEIKKAKTVAKIEKKQAKTANKTAKVAQRIDRKATKTQAKVEASKMPDIGDLMRTNDSAELEISEDQLPAEEPVAEITTDPYMTNVDMTDPESGVPVDMQAIEEIAQEPSQEDEGYGREGYDEFEGVDDNFLSAGGLQRSKARRAVKQGVKIQKKAGKAKAKVDKKSAKADKKQSRADARRTRSDAKLVRSEGRAEAKVLAAPKRHEQVASISKAASNIGIASAAALGAVGVSKNVAKALAAKKSAGEILTPEEEAQLKAAQAQLATSPTAEGEEEGAQETGAELQDLDKANAPGTKKAGIGGIGTIILIGLGVSAVAYMLLKPKKAA